ncbi:MAG TPA: hypothetical protein VMR86_18425 [Myxococcota bacterium]|nr:hypothetical protein [Myxococcota bacterium]
MSEAPYAPPAAELGAGGGARPFAPFFAVSQPKLLLLSLTTLGLYEFWWLHRNWLAFRERSDRRISAFWRTYLAFPFFIYPLLARIEREGRAHGLRMAVPAWLCAALYVLIYVPVRLSVVGVFVPSIPLMPANALLARLNQTLEPRAPARVRWSWLDVSWVCLVGAGAALAVLGSFRAAR